MSWLSNLFGGGKNPADSAMPYLNQIPGQTQPYYQPFINQGQQSGQDLLNFYQQMLNNPGELYGKLGQGYQQSPGYQAKLNAALGAGQNASAAGGMLGTPMDVQQQQQIGHDIADQDYENYMKNIMGLFGQGIQGQQGFQQQGFDASKGYADILGQTLGAKGQYSYAGQAGKNAQQSGLLNNLFNLGGLAGGWMWGQGGNK